MTVAEARAILRLDGPTDARSVRRAYLRAVKRHRPERDPDGFQHVRLAYETLQGARGRSAPSEGVVPLVPVVPVPSTDPVADDEPVAMGDATAAWTVTPPVTLPVARVVAGEPFPEALLAQATERADLEADEALSLVQRAMRAAIRLPPAMPTPLAAITPVLHLHRAGHATQASAAWRAVQGWIDALGLGTRLHHGVAARLLLTRELSELPTDFPTDLRRRIALAILTNDLVAAQPDVYDFARVQQLRAQEAAAQLATHAPNLAAAYHAVLVDTHRRGRREPGPSPRPRRRGPPPAWLLIALLVLLVALCGRGTDVHPTAPLVETPAPRTP